MGLSPDVEGGDLVEDRDRPVKKVTDTMTGSENVHVQNRSENVMEPDRKDEIGSSDTDTEIAQEMAPTFPKGDVEGDRDEQKWPGQQEGLGGQGLGWTGVVLSILAFFIYPVFLGIAGAIFGYIGYRQGAQTLGIWAMVLGGLAVLGALLFSPFFAG